MVNKKLTNLADGSDPRDAVTRKQLDNAGIGDITVDIDLKFLQYSKQCKENI